MSRYRDDGGAVAIVVAVALAALVGIGALAVDIGYWYASQQQLQTAADSAALAGCRELIFDGSNDDVWQSVEEYAGRNFRTPLEASGCGVVAPSPGGMSDITDEYVKVTVESLSPSFLSRVIGVGDTVIRAQAVARVGYLAGAVSPVPWGLNVLRVGSMTAILGGESTELWEQADSTWSSSFSAGNSGWLTLVAENSCAYAAQFPDIVRVGFLPSDGAIRGISVPKSTFTAGVDFTCPIQVAVEAGVSTSVTVVAQLGKSKRELVLNEATGLYQGTLPVPQTSDPFIVAPLSVELTLDGVAQQVEAAVLVRRANYVLQNVDVEPLFVSPTDSVSVSVLTIEFEYGRTYQLKVEGGAGTSGNFSALDFASLDHAQCGVPLGSGGYSGGASYRDWIIGVEGLCIHLLDQVSTLPGDKIGPTASGIQGRLAGVPLMTFTDWEDAGSPEVRQLLTVPICEQVEDIAGRTTFKIVSFGVFFIEQLPANPQQPIIGRFVDYAEPGLLVVDEAPYGIAIEAVHLDARELDF